MQRLTETVKHLIIINVIFYIGTYYVLDPGVMYEYFGLFSTESPNFKFWQLLTSMFMHGGFGHILFNMFALWMFGSVLESVWGQKKFLTFYFLTGFGSAALYVLIKYIQIQYAYDNYTDDQIDLILTKGAEAVLEGKNFIDSELASLNSLVNGVTIGASGAIAGLLMAFGIMFPNMELMLIFLPVPIKAKYFIPLLIVYELSMEFASFSWDNIAHLGHLSGMAIGFIIMRMWRNNQFNRMN